MKETTLKTKVSRVIVCTDKKKDGTEMKDKNGKKKWRVVINVPEHGQNNLTAFLYFDPQWKEGQEVEIIWWEEESEYNGQMQKQLYFKLPGKDDKVSKALEEANGRLLRIELMVKQIGQKLGLGEPDTYPDPKKEIGMEPKDHPWLKETSTATPSYSMSINDTTAEEATPPLEDAELDSISAMFDGQ